jgi:probable HAF family extracellular repeat protein
MNDYTEISESVWAFGKHSFRSQEVRDQLGAKGAGIGRWGWIIELEGDFTITPLIAEGGNDDGSLPADQVGTTVGNLKITRYSDFLEVWYSLRPGYMIGDLHLWVGCSLEELPKAGNSGRVAPNKFPYTYSESPTSSARFEIDPTNISCPGPLYLAANADELYESQQLSPMVTSQDWGLMPADGIPIPGKGVVDYVKGAFPIAVNDFGEVAGRQDIFIYDCYEEYCDFLFWEEQGIYWPAVGEPEYIIPMWQEEHSSVVKEITTDINNRGTITGFGSGYFPIVYESKTANTTELESLTGLPATSNALAINDLGQVVGYSENSLGESRAVLWNPESDIKELPILAGHKISEAIDNNNQGQVIGWSRSSRRSEQHYFEWDQANGIKDLGTEPVRSINDYGQLSSALSINNHGQTVSGDDNLYDPIIGVIELSALEGDEDCVAVDLNDQGQVVGTCYSPTTSRTRAVLWTITYSSNQIAERF